MISDASFPELPYFRKAEASSRFEISPAFGDLVVAGTNESSAVHRWFRFKESFSADLLRVILKDLGIRRRQIHLLDPFCGVGTSLLAAQELSAEGISTVATGIERNPFVAFVAKTKTSWPTMDQQLLRELPCRLLAQRVSVRLPLPQNSSFLTSRCITRHVTQRLLQTAAAVRRNGASASHDALLLGLASSIEPLSRTRKDGRALRLVEKDRTTVASVLRSKWDAILEDVALFQRNLTNATIPSVVLGDGRRPVALGVAPRSQDLILTSPPYPNNIDYTEVYKLELWLLGHVKTADEFLSLRRETFRSHPTCSLDPPSDEFLEAARRGRLRNLLSPILERIADLGEPWRERVLLGYFSDVWITLSESHRVLRTGGRAVFVVGNSLHGGAEKPYLVPTDLILAAIAERLGFRVNRTIAARALKRRLTGNHFLRESLVVLSKQDG